MADKQHGFLLCRLIMEEHSDKAYSLTRPELNTSGFPFLLHSLNMTLNVCGVFRFHRGIQCVEIGQTASAQRIWVGF